MITYRLADALPAHVRRDRPESEKLDALLDAGHGSCLLGRPDIAPIVIDNWLYFDTVRYDLLAWIVMPNHVHVLVGIRSGHSTSRIVHGWKSYTSKAIAKRVGTCGRVWQEDYWDRVIRSEAHLAASLDYIVGNPVAAGLAATPEEWPWSSAGTAGGPPALPHR